MAKRIIEATIAGTRPMKAYGGVEIDRQVLVSMAKRLRGGHIPMMLQHDPSRPIDVTILDAGVGPDGNGYERLWIRFEVDEAAWDAVDAEWKKAGAPGGFSWSGSEPIEFDGGNPDPAQPTVELAADAHFWSDEQIIEAAIALSRHANVHPARRYAFAYVPDPVVVATLVEVGKGLLIAGLWDSLKLLIRHRRTKPANAQDQATIFEFRVIRDGREVIGRVTTDDEMVLHRAIEALERLGELPAASWNDSRGNWESAPQLPPSPSDQ